MKVGARAPPASSRRVDDGFPRTSLFSPFADLDRSENPRSLKNATLKRRRPTRRNDAVEKRFQNEIPKLQTSKIENNCGLPVDDPASSRKRSNDKGASRRRLKSVFFASEFRQVKKNKRLKRDRRRFFALQPHYTQAASEKQIFSPVFFIFPENLTSTPPSLSGRAENSD